MTAGRAFAAALSEHPAPAHAVGEAVGQVLEAVGPAPDLALLFVTPPHAGAIEDMAGVVRDVLRPGALLGCTAESVVGGDREVEGGPAVALWAGRTGPVEAFALDTEPTPDGPFLDGWPGDEPPASALLVLADPFTFPVDLLLGRVEDDRPGLPVVGGMASAARGPGGNRLVLDGRVHTRGAVAALLPPGLAVTTVVSQGCRPVGQPFVVTRAERNLVIELAGQPAIQRLQQVAAAVGEDDRRLMAAGLHLGRVIDEHKETFDRGDFLVRNVMGADAGSGALVVGDLLEVGSTVQFHVRDAETADEDLRELLTRAAGDGGAGGLQGALLFTCNGRGTRLFPEPHHDARVLADALDAAPVAGFFAAGELGPVGGRNFLHGFTASVVLLRAPQAPRMA